MILLCHRELSEWIHKATFCVDESFPLVSRSLAMSSIPNAAESFKARIRCSFVPQGHKMESLLEAAHSQVPGFFP